MSVRRLSCSYLPGDRRTVPISRGSFLYRSYLGSFARLQSHPTLVVRRSTRDQGLRHFILFSLGSLHVRFNPSNLTAICTVNMFHPRRTEPCFGITCIPLPLWLKTARLDQQALSPNYLAK